MDENIEKNIEALEAEKKEYLEKNPEEDEEGKGNSDEEIEEVEVEETEIDLTEDEIDEWLGKLISLKEEKSSIELEIDEETSLKINYAESEEDELKGDEVIE